jgi:fatty acid desaturase
MFSSNSHKKDDKEPSTMGQRILGFCFAVFAGVLLLYLAIELLAQFWGWLALVALIVAIAWIVLVIYRRSRDGW